MTTLPNLDKTITKDPDPPPVDTLISPQVIPDGTVVLTTLIANKLIDNNNEIIDYISGDNTAAKITQEAIDGLVTALSGKEDALGFTPENVANKVTVVGTPGDDVNYPTEKATRDALDLKEDSLGFTPENAANKGAVSGYSGLDASQKLLLTNFPSGSALEVLRRNAGNTALEFAVVSGGTGNTFARVVKKADEIVNNSTAFQNDDELVVALQANKTYCGILNCIINSSAVADFKYAFTIPSGASGSKTNSSLSSVVAPASASIIDVDILNGIAADGMFQLYFKIIVTATAGNLQLRWAQNTAEVSDTKVIQGSSLVIWEELA